MKPCRTLTKKIGGCMLACALLLWLPGMSRPGAAKKKPVAVDDTFLVQQSETNVPLDVLDNDSDGDGDRLWITSFRKRNGFRGTVTGEPGLLRFTPSSGKQGVGTFFLTYTITDGWKTDSASVSITVQADHGGEDPGGDDKPPAGPELPTVGEVTGRLENWPVWPMETAGDRVNRSEPSPLTPVGRDMTAWVTFSVPGNGQTLWGETLSVMRSDGQGAVSLLSNGVRALANVDYYTPAATAETSSGSLDDGNMNDNLRHWATLPVWIEDWFVTRVHPDRTVTKKPNQIFPWKSRWDSFLKSVPKADGKPFADSGHAWPLVVWGNDSWTALTDRDYAPPGWGTTPRIFLPTNDGLLNILSAGETSYLRNSAILPGASFPVAVYQEHRKGIEGTYSRMTMLDGPITVRDVQDNDGKWHRVLAGSTGLGVDLENKPGTAWTKEGETTNPDGSPESLANGHHFALYAMDVTDPDYPDQLWTLENSHWNRKGSDNPADLDIEYCLTRPVLGYTTNGGSRIWHALFVGLDDSGGMKWMDLDPMTGQLHGSGSIGSEKNTLSAENIYPSRMLAAYPKAGGEPVLSDVYIYLSNGSLYYWNLQAGEVPRKLISFYTQGTGAGCPPITNFDVAYSDVNYGTGNFHTYFSVVIDRDLPGGNPGDSQSLLVVDLENLLGDDYREKSAQPGWQPHYAKMQGAEGKGGVTLIGSNPFQVQLDGGNGRGNGHGGNTDMETLAADPVFLDGTLYVATYSPEYDTHGWKHDRNEFTRLYTLPISRFTGSGKPGNAHNKKLPLVEGTDYTDFANKKATRFFVDGNGTLLLVDDTGTLVHSADVLDMPPDSQTGGTVPPDHEMEIIYWREK